MGIGMKGVAPVARSSDDFLIIELRKLILAGVGTEYKLIHLHHTETLGITV